jgi:hypothetical protein
MVIERVPIAVGPLHGVKATQFPDLIASLTFLGPILGEDAVELSMPHEFTLKDLRIGLSFEF